MHTLVGNVGRKQAIQQFEMCQCQGQVKAAVGMQCMEMSPGLGGPEGSVLGLSRASENQNELAGEGEKRVGQADFSLYHGQWEV